MQKQRGGGNNFQYGQAKRGAYNERGRGSFKPHMQRGRGFGGGNGFGM